jgi:hypothetical protein
MTTGTQFVTFWGLIAKSLLTPFQIRALWRFATTSISMVFQNRHMWNYVYPNEPPMVGVHIYMQTLRSYFDVISNPSVPNDILCKCVYETLSRMDTDLFNNTCFVIENAKMLPVYYQMKCPYALRFLVDEQHKLEMKTTPQINKLITSGGYDYFALCRMFHQGRAWNPDQFIKEMLLKYNENDNKFTRYVFVWMMSRNLTLHTVQTGNRNGDVVALNLLRTSFLNEFRARYLTTY